MGPPSCVPLRNACPPLRNEFIALDAGKKMQNKRHVSTQVTWLQIGITVDRRNLAGRQSAIRRPDCLLPGPGFEPARGSGARDAADGGYIFCFLNRSMPHMKRVDPSTPTLKKHTSPSISSSISWCSFIILILAAPGMYYLYY